MKEHELKFFYEKAKRDGYCSLENGWWIASDAWLITAYRNAGKEIPADVEEWFDSDYLLWLAKGAVEEEPGMIWEYNDLLEAAYKHRWFFEEEDEEE